MNAKLFCACLTISCSLLLASCTHPIKHSSGEQRHDLEKVEVLLKQLNSQLGRAAQQSKRSQPQIDIEASAMVGTGRVSIARSPIGYLTGLSANGLEIPVDVPQNADSTDRAMEFMNSYGGLFGIEKATQSLVVLSHRSNVNRVTLQQRHQGIDVFNGLLVVEIGDKGGVTWVNGVLVPDDSFPSSTPNSNGAELARQHGGNPESAHLGWFFDDSPYAKTPKVALAWRFDLASQGFNGELIVDDITGSDLRWISHVDYEDAPGAHREIFSCETCSSPEELPGDLKFDTACHITVSPLVPPPPAADNACVAPLTCVGLTGPCRTAEELSGNPKAVEDNLRLTEEFFWERFNRLGWDDTPGSPLHRSRASVGNLPGGGECNAFWTRPTASSGSARMGFGESRSTCLDVLVHEYTHAIASASNVFDPPGQCSEQLAVSEALADVFGELVEGGITGTTDWVHGTGCDGTACTGRSSPRNSSLRNPASHFPVCLGEDTVHPNCRSGRAVPFQAAQPDSFTGWRAECGGHWNSTIVSRIGYLMGREESEGALSNNGLQVSGIGLEASTDYWYNLLTRQLGRNADLSAFFTKGVLACLNPSWNYSQMQNCINAVSATGLWTWPFPNTLLKASPSLSGTPLLALHKQESDRKLHFVHNRPVRAGTGTSEELGDLFYNYSRCDSCPLVGDENIFGGVPFFGIGGALLEGGTSFDTGDALVVCFHDQHDNVRCVQRGDSGWRQGPAFIPRSRVSGGVSLAAYRGKLHMAYRSPSRTKVIVRTLEPGATYWGPEIVTDLESAIDPVLASSEADPIATDDNGLWMAYVESRNARLTMARFDPDDQEWIPASQIKYRAIRDIGGPGLPPVPTTHAWTRFQPALAFFRGRLHIAATGIGWETRGEPGTLHYASCAMPCRTDDWTEMVRMSSSTEPGLTLQPSGDYGGRLWLWSRPPGVTTIDARIKFSE